MSAKKKSCFQITSVTQAQVATGGCTDDAESLDDPDESRTEGASSEIYEPEVCDRRSSASQSTSNSIGESEAAAHRAAQAGGPGGAVGGPGQQTTSNNTTTTSCSSRFRVIKLDHSTGEPFRRGRWTCTEFYEREPEVTTGRPAEGTRHANEHVPDRDSGLGTSVVVQSSQAFDATTNTTTMLELSASHTSVYNYESGNDPSKTAQLAISTQTFLTPNLTQGPLVQISPVTPQSYQNQLPQNPQLPIGLHMPNQTGMTPEYGQQHLPHAVSMQGEVGISTPTSQSGVSVSNLMDWPGVMAPLATAPSVQIGPYSGVAMIASQNSPTPNAVGIPVPEPSRRKSDASVSAPLLAPVKEVEKFLITEESSFIPNPGVNSLFGIIDGDEDR